MTSQKDSENAKEAEKDLDTATNSAETRSEEISLWLAGTIVFFLILVFVVAGLIVHKVYFQPPVIRTAVERDLVRYQAAIKSNPKDAGAYIGLAGVYLQTEQPEKAIKELNTALEIKPRSWNAHFELGMAYDAIGEKNNAISHFWQAASIDPENELAFYQLGMLYSKQKKYTQAIEAFKTTLRINPTLADAHYFLGRCYEDTGKVDNAKNEYRDALKYVTNYPEAKKALEKLEH